MKRTLCHLVLYLLIAFSAVNCRPKSIELSEKPIAENLTVNNIWLEITPRETLVATTNLHFVGLEFDNVKTWTDETKTSLKLNDGSELHFDVELVSENGEVTKLYPNSIAKYIEFGKRTLDRTNVDDAYFKVGQKFVKIRIKCDKTVYVRQVVWAKFDF